MHSKALLVQVVPILSFSGQHSVILPFNSSLITSTLLR